jgi:acyl-CoA synthetase (AMP-forming)/AMP-acid ligase II
MTAPVPPISTQVSRLAQLAPDEPAVTCEGRTLTRGELDASTNRLARAYAELGVGVGDYVTIVLPNSIEWIQAIIACWKLGAVPQPMSARLPAAEFIGILDLKPRALIVGREDPRGEVGSVVADFVPDEALSDAPLPEAVSPVWKAMTSGGSTGRPKLIEAGGDSRVTAAPGSAPTYRYIGATAKSRDGWDSLGDLGYFDEDGFLYLNDRRVDMFTVGGRNVYPAEIEAALSAHPNVLSCLVVGIPDEDLGQVPHAIVRADGLDEAAVIAFLKDRIAAYKVPRTVEFTDTPLRDDAGKARRSAVRDEIIARRVRARP